MSLPSEEQWRPIPGYDNYLVSNRGNVYSKPRPRAKAGILAPIPNANRGGYLYVTLHANGRRDKRPIHQLVAAAFIGPRPRGQEGEEIRHLDGDVANNCVDNLTYGSRSLNNLDKRRHGTDYNARKTRCPQGHPYSGENLYVIPSTGGRMCRTCQRDRLRKVKAA